MDKRRELAEWCNGHTHCKGCVLHTPDHRCGRGAWFFEDMSKYTMSDKEIDKAYEAVFGNKKSADTITIEKGDIISAAITVGISGELYKLITHEPTLMLLLPIIGNEIENILFKKGESNHD